ncbi:MAG: hypothetical protein NVSMB6_02600 [Burkholderiaceae bacterium]
MSQPPAIFLNMRWIVTDLAAKVHTTPPRAGPVVIGREADPTGANGTQYTDVRRCAAPINWH